jgi:CheY-like chemotaxis protein
MPGVDGFAVLDRLKGHPDTRHIPVHIISGLERRHEGLSAGAIAYLEKPVSAEALDDAFGRIAAFLDRRVRRLLVVEDDAAQRTAIEALIAHEDVEITAVASAEAALAALGERPFDCVVLDLGLAGTSGFELLERVKADPAWRDLPIIVYTGKSLTPEEDTRLRRYAETIIIKDVKSPERLLDETALFLHRVEANLPDDKRRVLERLHTADAVFQGKRVLVVDDDVRNIFSLTSMLEEHGIEVAFAENGRDALAWLEQHGDDDRGGAPLPTDLVLMDVMMPGMDGYDTTRAVRANPAWRGLPIIAVTGQGDEGRPREVPRGGGERLHHEAGRPRAAALAAARVAVPLTPGGDGLPAAPASYDPALERVEVDLLLEGIYRHYGFDFRGYAYASLRRRIWKRAHAEGLESVSALQARVLHDPTTLDRLLDDLSVNVTAMFRDPAFWAAFRARVVPVLRTYPFFRIWHAGCATGEEVYAMAILLEEEGLYDRARVYATDMNERVLRQARTGIFPLDRMKEYTENYLKAGGAREFSGYYTAGYDGARFSQRSSATWCSRSTTSSPTARSASSTRSSAATCSSTSTRRCRRASTGCATTRWRCSACSRSAAARRCASRRTRSASSRWRQRRRSTGRCGDRRRARRAGRRPARRRRRRGRRRVVGRPARGEHDPPRPAGHAPRAHRRGAAPRPRRRGAARAAAAGRDPAPGVRGGRQAGRAGRARVRGAARLPPSRRGRRARGRALHAHHRRAGALQPPLDRRDDGGGGRGVRPARARRGVHRGQRRRRARRAARGGPGRRGARAGPGHRRGAHHARGGVRHLATAERARWDVAPLDQLGARVARGVRALLGGGALRGAAA